MTTAADISVAVATLDRPAGLEACLQALTTGEWVPGEIIVVDQSSSRQSEALARSYAIDYIRQPRLGLSASRNAAIARATKPVLAFTDDDCVPHMGWVAAVQRAFARPDVDAVTGPVLPLGQPAPGTFVVSPRHSRPRTDFTGRHIPWLLGTGGNFALRRPWFDRIGLYDQRLGAGSPGRAAEDADLFYRLLLAGATVCFEPNAIVFHARQTRAQRAASRFGYGHGIGAFCALRIRARDPYVVWILAYWLLTLGREMASHILRGDGFEVYQRWLGLTGSMRGFVYGLRA